MDPRYTPSCEGCGYGAAVTDHRGLCRDCAAERDAAEAGGPTPCVPPAAGTVWAAADDAVIRAARARAVALHPMWAWTLCSATAVAEVHVVGDAAQPTVRPGTINGKAVA